MINKMIQIRKEGGFIKVTFPYNPDFAEKIKSIKRHRWNLEEKYWSFPNTNGTLDDILKVFEGEKIYLDPDLKQEFFGVITKKYSFKDLKRELISRKYPYKTIKCYLYFNRDFLNFTGKEPSNITDEDIKNYLVYLTEKKQSATSTQNQAINALKFYYGTMLKRKFVYEVRRPRKDEKLPVVLSKEEVAKILSSVSNVKHKAILMLIYSAGLRVGKVVKLKPEDVDGKRMLIHIKVQREERRCGYLEFIIKHSNHKNGYFLGQKKEGSITTRTVQKIFEDACKKQEYIKILLFIP